MQRVDIGQLLTVATVVLGSEHRSRVAVEQGLSLHMGPVAWVPLTKTKVVACPPCQQQRPNLSPSYDIIHQLFGGKYTFNYIASFLI